MRFLKRNQIIISIIALMLITAGYFNYVDNIASMEVSANSIFENTENEEKIDNTDEFAAIGDAKLVDAEVESENALIDNKTEGNIHNDEENITSSDSQQQVNAQNTDDYFAASRLERSSMYSEMIAVYERMIENPNVSETQKGIATNEIYNINTVKNAIMISENLIKNKGFEDVVIFSNKDSINVIVKASELQTEHIAQIQNIIYRELNAATENIHISCK